MLYVRTDLKAMSSYEYAIHHHKRDRKELAMAHVASAFMQNCEANRRTKNYLDKASLNNKPKMRIFMIADRKPRCAVFCFRHRPLHCALCVWSREWDKKHEMVAPSTQQPMDCNPSVLARGYWARSDFGTGIMTLGSWGSLFS
jgi:hypothetical protein